MKARQTRINGELGRRGVRPIVVALGEAWTDDRGHGTYVHAEEFDIRSKRLARWAQRLELSAEEVQRGLGGGSIHTHRVPSFLYAISAQAFRMGLPGEVHWMLDDVLADIMRFRTQRRRVEVARAAFQLLAIAADADFSFNDRAQAAWLFPIRATVSGWLYDEREERRRCRI